MKKYITKSISLLKNLPQQKNGAERCKGLILQKKWPIMKSKATKTIIENAINTWLKKYNIYICGRGSNNREGYCDIIHIMLLCSSSLDENGWLEEISFFFSIEVDRVRIAYITPS